jgi:hypothetical protein
VMQQQAKVITGSTPVVTGPWQKGMTLTAVPGPWGPSGVSLSYQWQADGAAITGATSSTFVPTDAQVGKQITVTVTGSRPGYPNTSSTSAGVGPVASTFADAAPDSVFGAYIQWMSDQGISTGYVESSGFRTFHPVESVTRRAMAAFLYRMAGSPAFTPPATPSFSDVPANALFFKEIEWMKSRGITTGNADGTFSPDDPVSRQAMSAFLFRFSGSPAFTPPTTASFTDVAVGSTFFTQVEWMKANAITTGYQDGPSSYSYHPVEDVSRQAMAAFLYRQAHSG